MNSASLTARINARNVTAKVLVIGDVMLDRYTQCQVMGLSPECPATLKVQPRNTVERPGGAANVAANLKRLGMTQKAPP